jgi:hypothetical protein
MSNTYPDIAATPGITGYPIVNKQTNGNATTDAQNAADFQRILNKLSAAGASTAHSAPQAPPTGGTSFKSFIKGLWDVINPLQHIPVVSAIYRHVTGDTISPGAHFIGDALYGGPIGGAIAAADIAYQKTTGKDMGETVIASLTGHNHTPAPTNAAPDTMIAQNLSAISPAAGSAAAPAAKNMTTPAAKNTTAPAAKNIIWSDNNNSKNIIWTSESPLFPPSQPTGTIGEGPASPSTPAQPVLPANSTVSTSAVQMQEAPAGTARTAVPPELIASKMMEGLEKYAQMKQQSLNPQLSGLY